MAKVNVKASQLPNIKTPKTPSVKKTKKPDTGEASKKTSKATLPPDEVARQKKGAKGRPNNC